MSGRRFSDSSSCFISGTFFLLAAHCVVRGGRRAAGQDDHPCSPYFLEFGFRFSVLTFPGGLAGGLASNFEAVQEPYLDSIHSACCMLGYVEWQMKRVGVRSRNCSCVDLPISPLPVRCSIAPVRIPALALWMLSPILEACVSCPSTQFSAPRIGSSRVVPLH